MWASIYNLQLSGVSFQLLFIKHGQMSQMFYIPVFFLFFFMDSIPFSTE